MFRCHSKNIVVAAIAMVIASAVQPQAAVASPAQGADQEPPPVKLEIADVDPPRVQLGSEIRIRMKGLPEKLTKDAFDPGKYALYLNNQRFPSITGRFAAEENVLLFTLRRGGLSTELDAWNRILGGSFAADRTVTLAIGMDDGNQLVWKGRPNEPPFTIQVFSQRALGYSGFGLALTLLAFVLLAVQSDIIRNTGAPAPPGGARRPYSLARLQMAVWFFVVLASFIFIYVITRDTNTISAQALALIGIGSGTALGAAAIDANKRDASASSLSTLEPQEAGLIAEIAQAQQELVALPNPRATIDEARARELAVVMAEKTARQKELTKQVADLKAQQPSPSKGLITDILTDANGISFHRFQMLAWTVVIVCIFINGVFRNLTMPALDSTLLALMGISAGTYLGFKIPEKQT